MSRPSPQPASYETSNAAGASAVARDLGTGSSRHDALASAWMHQGFAAVNQGNRLDLERALHCFDQAIAVREPLLTSDQPCTAYHLAGAWMNRGDVLDRIGGEAQLDAAIASYDCALALLSAWTGLADERYRERRATAHLHRGRTLLSRGKYLDLKESIRTFETVLAILGKRDADHQTEGEHCESAELIAASAREHHGWARNRLEAWESAPLQRSANAGIKSIDQSVRSCSFATLHELSETATRLPA